MRAGVADLGDPAGGVVQMRRVAQGGIESEAESARFLGRPADNERDTVDDDDFLVGCRCRIGVRLQMAADAEAPGAVVVDLLQVLRILRLTVRLSDRARPWSNACFAAS